jgi:putative membrane protein
MTTAIATVLGDHGWHDHGWAWIPFLWTFWLVLAVLLFWRFGRGRLRRGEEAAATDRGRAVLAERYARGEIDADEYRERLDTLEQSGRSTAG